MSPTPEQWTAHGEEHAAVNPGGHAINPDRFLSVTRARCIARYKMKSIAGRPEELVTHDGLHQISFAYAGGEMRIRKHDGREWIDHRDFRLRDGWLSDVYDYLDSWMGYLNEKDIRAPRPIRDNPQA